MGEQAVGPRNRLSLGIVSAAICICIIMLMFYQSKGRLGKGSNTGKSNQVNCVYSTISPTMIPGTGPIEHRMFSFTQEPRNNKENGRIAVDS